MGTIIYGGSFNPPHIGHMRMAIESHERLSHLVDKVDFVPVFCPPHKDASTLLPYSLRMEMLKVSIKNLPFMNVNDMESHVDCPSYTWNLLQEYHRQDKTEELYFLLGSMDYELLPTWFRGLELINLANLVVAPRGKFSVDNFLRTTRGFAQQTGSDFGIENKNDNIVVTIEPAGKRIFYLPLLCLDISSSEIRKLWRAGNNIDFLVPDEVIAILKKNEKITGIYWRE